MVTHLAMQHTALGEGHIEPLARAGDRHVHQAALFLQPIGLHRAVLVREQPFLQAGDEHHVEFEALGRVHGHHLHRVLAGLGLVVAGLQRGMGQERHERRHHHRQLLGIEHLEHLVAIGQHRRGVADPVGG
ncbi:hypothetical protein D3C85_1222670 [compost metagenome]